MVHVSRLLLSASRPRDGGFGSGLEGMDGSRDQLRSLTFQVGLVLEEC